MHICPCLEFPPAKSHFANAHGSDNHHNFIPQVLDFRGLITLPLSLQLSNQQHNTHGQGQL
ncbi:hypothetical protein TWF788_003415 [Orbilia oligospora]|uniref:Uncharacterized protein n=1 Tax=Orbilia oligospora TaxID=2813651 RepID=A0A7C8PIE5_ORBOL|nr:hypothetical protein TWF788_003415 [Orbilia oligospora]